MRSFLRFKLSVALAALAISGLATAQDAPGPGGPGGAPNEAAGDPPSRVMRLQYMDGQVSLQPGGVDDWVAANLNRPLTTADRIWTDQGARAELTMASAALRMGSETSVTVTNLDDATAQIELDQGTMDLSVRYLNAGEIVEVDTPNFAYTVTRPGDYRFDVLPDQDQSWITVRRGDGEATGQANAVRVNGGQQFRFSQGQSLSYTNSGLPDRDGFDDWCAVRERRETSSPSAGYVAAGTVGYEDLDDNGRWQPTPVYGNVWYPNVAPGWAPYRYGHWAWVEPWGWTWVDDAPWGFAPFHYGRWAFIGDRWGWIPGPVGVRPVYAPALVAWVGGPAFGVSIGVGGGVGWIPLGWHDPFIPAYHVSPIYARNVNISSSRVVNVTVINNYYNTTNVTVRNTAINNIHYENVAARGAVTAVPGNAFAAGQPVSRVAVVVPPTAVAHVNVMAAATVVPTRAAVLGGRPPAAMPQHLVAPRPVISRVAPPPRPVSFEQQRPMLEKNNGMPLTPQARATIRAANPPAPRVNAPMSNQPRPNQPTARPTSNPNQPAANQPFNRAPAVDNSPAARPATPNIAPSNNQPASRANQPAANVNNNQTAPARNVPRPPVTNSNPQNSMQGGQSPSFNRPGTTANQNAPRPNTTATTPQTPHATTAPSRTATPATQQKRTPPTPQKEEKDKNKDRDR